MSTARAVRRPYCLHCYSPLAGASRTSVTCERCDALNVLADQRRFWTLEPGLRQIEKGVKGLLLVLLALVLGSMLNTSGIHFGKGRIFELAIPIMITVLLWETANKITQRRPHFRAGLFWTAVPLVIGVPLCLAVLLAEEPWSDRGAMGGVAVGLVAFGLAVRWLEKRAERWRDERVLRGQREAK